MEQEELRKRLRKIEKVNMNMFPIGLTDKEMRKWSLVYDVDEAAAEAELEKLNISSDAMNKGVTTQIGNETIIYNEAIVTYYKFSKIFCDLAKVQKKKFYNQIEIRKEGEITFYISEEVRVLMEETLDTAYEWIQKLGISDFSRKDMQAQYCKRAKVDFELLVASFLKIVESGLLAHFKRDEEEVILDDEGGRTNLHNPMIVHSMTGAVYDLGAVKNQSDYMRILDSITKERRMIEKYANFLFAQTIDVGRYVVELLVESDKIPRIVHNCDVQMIYKIYLLKFLRGEISDDDYSDVLWTILGESLDNEMIMTGILNFEAVHDARKEAELCRWIESQGYYLKDTSKNNIYYYSEMEDNEFIGHYEAAVYSAQNEVELQYYIQRYREWYLDTKTDVSKKRKYVCESYHAQIETKLQKINNVESKVYEEYGKIEGLKTHADSYLKERKWFEAIELVDGRCGYVEEAIFNVIDGLIKYKYEAAESKGVKYIGILLEQAQFILDEVDKSVKQLLEKNSGLGDAQRTIALNVLRSACHYCFIQTEHFALNMTDEQMEGKYLNLYKQWKTHYKLQREEKSLQMMKQCEVVIMQGANKGNALACILLLENRISSNINQQQREVLIQVATQKYCPTQMVRMGEKLLTDRSKALEAYYCYLMAQKIAGESERISEGIQKAKAYIVTDDL